MIAGVFAALLLLLPAPQDPADARTHEELAAALVAVLPPAEDTPDEPDRFAEQRIANLVERHPARAPAIRDAFSAREKCLAAEEKATIDAAMMAVALGLTDDELRKMIAFYTGPDHATVDKLDEQSAEFKALLERYPLMRFYELMTNYMTEKLPDAVISASETCDAGVATALSRVGISE